MTKSDLQTQYKLSRRQAVEVLDKLRKQDAPTLGKAIQQVTQKHNFRPMSMHQNT